MLEILQYAWGLILIYFHVGLINVGDEVKEINGIKFQGRDPKDMTKVLVRIVIVMIIKFDSKGATLGKISREWSERHVKSTGTDIVTIMIMYFDRLLKSDAIIIDNIHFTNINE